MKNPAGNKVVVITGANVFDADVQKRLWELTCRTLEINFDMI